MLNFKLWWKDMFDTVLPDGLEFVWEEGGYEKFLLSPFLDYVETEEEDAS